MTSVPPTQPPAAPKTDVRLREALHRAFRDHWGGPNEPLDLYADSPLWKKQAEAVERIVAERVRVVEGERDAAMAETEMALRMHDVQWSRANRYKARAEAAEAERDEAKAELAVTAEVRDVAQASARLMQTRAESAEAAHRALQAERDEAWRVAAQRRDEARRYYVAWQVARMRARVWRRAAGGAR